MFLHKTLAACLVVLMATVQAEEPAASDVKARSDESDKDGKIVQYGEMHEAIGNQRHEGRVRFKKLVKKPHFFGVAALENLEGEATIYDGEVTITRVRADGQIEPHAEAATDLRATLLVGAYVPSWTKRKVTSAVKPDDFDEYLAAEASKAGLNTSEPFVFTVEGKFSDGRLHVINGACPMRARLKKIEIPEEQKPFELETNMLRGKIVGVFAKDAVGKITHPDTSTHMHLLFKDPESGRTVTGHIERIGLMEGAVLRFPAAN